MSFPWGAIAGAGASLVGSGLSFLGGQEALGINSGNQAYANTLAYQQQQFERQAAQQGIQWRVADAKAAGISPLVALGAPTFNPGAIGVSGSNFDNPLAAAGAGLSGMGQDISRAAMAAQTENTRMQTVLAAEKIRADTMASSGEAEKNAAQAGYYRALTDKVSGAMIGPPMPSQGRFFVDGQGTPVGTVKSEPSKSISDAGGQHSIEAGITPAVKPVQMQGGGIDPQPSLGTSVGSTGETIGYTIRNRLNPPSGYHVGWDGGWYRDEGSSWWDRPLGYSRYSEGKSSWGSPDYSGVSGMLPY